MKLLRYEKRQRSIFTTHSYKNSFKLIKESKVILCFNCGEKIDDGRKKKCKVCGGWIYEGYEPRFNTERNKEIVSHLETGLFTLAETATIYKLTRERVRQLYKKTTGKPYSLILQRKIKIRALGREVGREKHLQEIKFICTGCQKPVSYREAGHKTDYCQKCFTIWKKEFRNPKLTHFCVICRKPFHPYRNYKHQGTGAYCSRACYFIRNQTRY